MTASDSSVGGSAGQFHTTRWTLVMASAREQSQTGRAALAALCQIYWYRNRYLAVVREEVARTVSDPAEIESEIRALCDALIAAEGRKL